MYKNDALQFRIAESPFEFSRVDAANKGHVVFLALTSLIVTIAFLVPFGDSWMRSVTYQEYFLADHVEAGTREGRLDRQIAVGLLGLWGLAAVAWPGGKAPRISSVLAVFCMA